MTAGELTVFLAYLSQFFKPVKDLATMTNSIAQTAVGVDRVRAILEADDVISEGSNARDPGPLKGKIEFECVAFGYQKDVPILKDVSFTIEAGEMIGVVGPTGAGKSTVMNLIPRFYDPGNGKVMIDGVDVREYKLKGLRDQIAYVLQETILFRGTVAENIAYGRGSATRDEIVAAAKLANADEFISKMAQGYDTMVGDRGDTLSGGQKQRIGIARAIIRANPILILDEPTAALDTESEQIVVEALRRLMQGRTVITIAHRLSTIRDANRIFVLKDGVLAEQGSHAELMARDGVYAELYRIQFDEKQPVA
jgi:ABC-type multidrug transport system fused ATPase/permease subunit